MAKHGQVKKYSKQHFIPQCYTKPWCDPASFGPRISPYVWQFDRAGANSRRKAPANLFTETDIYTIEGVDGERDLRLEHGFQELEDKFTRIRNSRFGRNEWPDDEQMDWVIAFVATAHGRTVDFRDFHQEQWGNIRHRMEAMQTALDNASPEQQKAFRRMEPFTDSKSKGMSIEDVRRIEERPIHELLAPTLHNVLPIYARMYKAILCTDDPIGFVTTDSPVTWYNPEAYKLPPLYRNPGLARRTIEVTLPISPSQCLLITHNPEQSGYFKVDQDTLDMLNRRHIAFCYESFIVRKNEVRPNWFEMPELPDDAWEKVRERKITSGEWSED
jgi:hypothetical protein